MNWDKIKYIFQIPLGWYRKIHNMVYHAYGTNFLTVREGYYGGMEIGVDSDGFAEEVKRAVDLSGYVKYVDHQQPDEDGNVNLSGYVKTIDEQEPDEYGNLYLSGYVKTIDGEEPDLCGNIELSDYYVTIDTDQTISGYKVFENVVTMSNGLSAYDADIYVDESNKLNIDQDTALAVNTPLVQLNDTTTSAGIDIYPEIGGIEIYPQPNYGGGGYIDFHTNGANNDYDSRIIDLSDGFSIRAMDKPLYLYSYYQNTSNPTGIVISSAGGQYQQLLTNEPARLYSQGADNQIASRGYVRLNFSRNTHTHGNISNSGQITADSGATPTNYYIAADSSGNLFRKDSSELVPSLANYVTYGAMNTALQNYALTSTVDSLVDVVDSINDSYQTASDVNTAITEALADYTTSEVQPEINDALEDYTPTTDLQQNYVSNTSLTTTLQNYTTTTDLQSNYVSNNSLTTTLEDYTTTTDLNTTLQDYTTTTDLNTTLQDYATVATLESEYVTMGELADELDNYIESGEFASGFPAATQNGKSITNMKVVTDVTWNGTTLQYKYRNLSFDKGLLTSYGTELTTTIDTPTVITWA